MALSERHLLAAVSRTPFVDSTVLAGFLGEPYATVHRTLSNLLAEGIVGTVNHGTAHLPSSQICHFHTWIVPLRALTGTSWLSTTKFREILHKQPPVGDHGFSG